MDGNIVVSMSAAATAIATVIYTIGTFLLWRSSKKALDATNDAVKLNFLIAVHQIRASTLDATIRRVKSLLLTRVLGRIRA